MTDAVAVILTTVPESCDWEALARDAVAAGLAACVQCDTPMASVYSWQGELCRDTERRLTIKTSPQSVAALYEFVCGRHPYDVPQWIVLQGEASAAYGRWVHELTGTRAKDQ